MGIRESVRFGVLLDGLMKKVFFAGGMHFIVGVGEGEGY